MRPEVARAAALLTERVGFAVDGTSTRRITTAFDDGAAAGGLTREDYVVALERRSEAFQDFLDRVTVQETAFFRHPQQLEFLRDSLLATLPQPLTIWSAACSNGQEAYSLAMLLEELRLPGTIYATDISSRALARTRAARYEERELRGLSPERRDRFLVPADGMYECSPAVRARVRVQRHNLAADAPPMPPGTCHLVLCRNVLIYFSPAETVAFLRRLHAHLPIGGHLMVGGSESLLHVTDVFEIERREGVYLYRRAAHRGAQPHAVRRHEPAPRMKARAVDPQPKRAGATGTRARLHEPPVAPRRPTSRSVPDAASVAGSDVPALDEIREAAADAAAIGAWASAASAYRQLLYLSPGDTLAAVELGLVLEASGDQSAAARAFRVARRSLTSLTSDDAAPDLGGYQMRELTLLLDTKLEEAA